MVYRYCPPVALFTAAFGKPAFEKLFYCIQYLIHFLLLYKGPGMDTRKVILFLKYVTLYRTPDIHRLIISATLILSCSLLHLQSSVPWPLLQSWGLKGIRLRDIKYLRLWEYR